MTRSKHILALLVSLVALAALAPAASAANRSDGFRMGSVDSEGFRAGSVDPNPVRYGSLELDRRHARGIGRKGMKIKAIGLHGNRFSG
jgi:hypothetical protein